MIRGKERGREGREKEGEGKGGDGMGEGVILTVDRERRLVEEGRGRQVGRRRRRTTNWRGDRVSVGSESEGVASTLAGLCPLLLCAALGCGRSASRESRGNPPLAPSTLHPTHPLSKNLLTMSGRQGGTSSPLPFSPPLAPPAVVGVSATLRSTFISPVLAPLHPLLDARQGAQTIKEKDRERWQAMQEPQRALEVEERRRSGERSSGPTRARRGARAVRGRPRRSTGLAEDPCSPARALVEHNFHVDLSSLSSTLTTHSFYKVEIRR